MSSSASLDLVSRPAVRRSEEEMLRALRRRGWLLAGYSAALLLVAGVLTAVSSPGEVWRAYGLACLIFGGAVGLVAAVMLLRERPELIALPGRLIRGAHAGTVSVGAGMRARRAEVAERRHPVDRAVGGLPGMGVTQFRVIRSEWTKLYSVRSTFITLLVAAGLIVGLAALVSGVIAGRWDELSAIEQAAFRPGTDPLSGVGLAQLAVGVLGVLTSSSEYATGMIRTTLAAVPRRISVLWGKLIVLSALVGVVALATMFVSFWIAQALLSGKGLSVGLDAPYVLHVILAAPVYLVMVAAMGLALGALLRHTAGAISAFVGLLFLLPILFALLPTAWAQDASPYLFGSAGQAFWAVPSGNQLTPAAAAFVVTLAWTGTAFAAAAYRLLRDDA